MAVLRLPQKNGAPRDFQIENGEQETVLINIFFIDENIDPYMAHTYGGHTANKLVFYPFWEQVMHEELTYPSKWKA